MRFEIYSYRFAQEILQHSNYSTALDEILTVIKQAPLFVYPHKSRRNPRLDVVQQVMNTYFDRRLGVDFNWDYHPLATNIQGSGLKADFRKGFGTLGIQAEVQFGNMSRWYSDIFKFQTAYSQGLVQLGLSVVPVSSLAKRIDSNVVNFERARRELPSAELSITLPIMLIGVAADQDTPIVDISQCGFSSIAGITGKNKSENRWRIVNGFINGIPMSSIGPDSDPYPMIGGADSAELESDDQ